MLENGAIVKVKPEKGFMRKHFPEREKSTRKFRPIINLRQLNEHVPYQKFKMESLKDLKNLLKKEDFVVKVDLKDAYYTVPLNQKESGKSVRFQWNGNLFEFICLMFGLGPCPRIFKKNAKITEDSNNNSKEVEHEVDNLHRRHVNNGVFEDVRNTHGQRHSAIFTRGTRVCDQLRKVCVDTNNSDGVSGNPHQQPNHDSDTTRENEKSSRHVSKDTGLKNHNSQRTSTCSRKVTGNSTSIHPSPLQLRHLQRQHRLSLQTNMSYETVITLKREACLVHCTGG